MPFQVEAVEKTVAFLRGKGAAYNSSEMGCGKSAITIRAIEAMGLPEAKILVICPAIVCLVWEKEIRKWSQELEPSNYYVISYEKAAKEKYYADLKALSFDFLVLDESHYLKNLKAKRTQNILKHIWPVAKYKICLSGTPMTQSVMDMWPVISKICPEDFGSYWDFAKQFTNMVRTPFGPGYKFEGVKNHEKLRSIIKSKFFFRYTKEQVLKDLPPKTYQCIPLGPEYRVEADPEAQEHYLKLLKQSIVLNLPPPQPPVPIATLFREQGLKKVPAVVEYCKNILDSDTPLVVFFQHTAVGQQLETELNKYAPVKIEGSTSQEQRKAAIEDFQSGKTNLFLGQIKAAGIGITLTRASTVAFAELSYSPADISQACDRTHRMGQLNNVTIYYFSVIDSLDERIQDVLMRKSSDFKKVLGENFDNHTDVR